MDTPALRITRSRVNLSPMFVGRLRQTPTSQPQRQRFTEPRTICESMNPDKLFDYLEGRLSPRERAALEEQLMLDKELQREFAVARQIHAGMRGDSREVVLPASPDGPEQGRNMAIRIGVAFIVLMLVNVGIGLYFIFWHESKNPNRPLLEAQMREQIAKSIERAGALTPAPNVLGVTEITIAAGSGKIDTVANEVVTIAARLGGSATKGLQDSGRLNVLVDVPSNREQEFRVAVASISGNTPVATPPVTANAPATGEKKSFVVQIVEATPS
jgi:anti-sigma factor RsiW